VNADYKEFLLWAIEAAEKEPVKKRIAISRGLAMVIGNERAEAQLLDLAAHLEMVERRFADWGDQLPGKIAEGDLHERSRKMQEDAEALAKYNARKKGKKGGAAK
jgi:hypothetical protein